MRNDILMMCGLELPTIKVLTGIFEKEYTSQRRCLNMENQGLVATLSQLSSGKNVCS